MRRINNGAAFSGTSTSTSSSTSRTVRSEEVYTASEGCRTLSDVEEEESGQLNQLLQADPRNGRGRSVTPAKSIASSTTSWNSSRTRQSAASHTTTMTAGGTRRRKEVVRRQVLTSAGEEHPYGLVSNAVLPPHNAHNQQHQQQREPYKIYRRGGSVYSSESDTSTAGDTGEVESSIPLIRSAMRYIKKGFYGIGKFIYLFLVFMVYLEKWCLYDRRKKEDVGVGGSNGRVATSSTSSYGRNYVTNSNQYNSYSSRQAGRFDAASTSTPKPMGQMSSARWQDQQRIIASRRRTWITTVIYHFTGVEEEEDQQGGNPTIQLLWKILGILLRLLLVIFLLFLIWNYGGYILWPVVRASSVLLSTLYDVTSAFVSNLSCTICSWVAVLLSSKPQSTAPVATYESSSVNIELPQRPQASPSVADVAASRKQSEEALAAFVLTQEEINALKDKLGRIESVLKEHETRLDTHDTKIVSMEAEISTIVAAMKAASAKEKSWEQIVEEILSVSIGETDDGNIVSLKSLFGIIEAKADYSRISEELTAKIRVLSGDIEDSAEGMSAKVVDLKYQLDEMNSRISEISEKAINIETKSAQNDVDMDKMRDAVLPILLAEIEKKVSVSCATRKCPEGSLYGGLSTEDIELMIKRAIGKYDADKTGLPDLALESAGGSILSTRCTKSSELRNSVISYWGFRLWSPPNTPRTIIQPGVVPGECWAFEGSVGDVVIKLAVPSIVTGFTLEHIPKAISRNGHIDSAPRHFQVLGLQSEHDTEEVHDYGSFTYEDNNEPLQFFPVTNLTAKAYPIVELKVLSNHGNMKHTCLYRFRVHGAIDLGRSHGDYGSKSAVDGEGGED